MGFNAETLRKAQRDQDEPCRNRYECQSLFALGLLRALLCAYLCVSASLR